MNAIVFRGPEKYLTVPFRGNMVTFERDIPLEVDPAVHAVCNKLNSARGGAAFDEVAPYLPGQIQQHELIECL